MLNSYSTDVCMRYLHISYTAVNVEKTLQQNIFIDEMHLAVGMPFSPRWLQRQNMALGLHINICSESHPCSPKKHNWAWPPGRGNVSYFATWNEEFTNIMSVSVSTKLSYIISAASFKSRSSLLDKLRILSFSGHHVVYGVCVGLLPSATPTKLYHNWKWGLVRTWAGSYCLCLPGP